MTRTLLLIRHAKAVQGGTPDDQRALAPRGVNDAQAAGRWLVEHCRRPTYAIVSPAVRAQQTWAAIASQLIDTSATATDDRIYDNTVESLLAAVHDAPADEPVVALVGHNPSMHELAYALDDGAGDAGARALIASSYPTNGIAMYAVTARWSDLELGGATLLGFIAPRA